MNKKSYFDDVGMRASEMYYFHQQRSSNKEIVPPYSADDVVSAWDAWLVHVARNAIMRISQSGAVYSPELVEVCSTYNRSLYAGEDMTKTPMLSWTTLKEWLGAELHTDVEEVIMPVVDVARYIVSFIKETSVCIRACPKETEGETVELLRQHWYWVERQMDGLGKNSFLDGGQNVKRT